MLSNLCNNSCYVYCKIGNFHFHHYHKHQCMMDILGDISRVIKLKQGKTKALLGIGGSSQM